MCSLCIEVLISRPSSSWILSSKHWKKRWVSSISIVFWKFSSSASARWTNLPAADEIIRKQWTRFSGYRRLYSICWAKQYILIWTLFIPQRACEIQNLREWKVGYHFDCSPEDRKSPRSHRANLRINQYFGYFGVAIKKWLSVARNKLLHRIEYALEKDKIDASVVTPVNNKWTISSMDIASCFTQMVQFWRRLGSIIEKTAMFFGKNWILAWPDILSSIAFLIKITEDMANATRLYATISEGNLNAKKFYDTNDLTFYTQEVNAKNFFLPKDRFRSFFSFPWL